MAAEQLLRYAFDTAKDLAETLHEPAVRALMPCSCGEQRAPVLEQRQELEAPAAGALPLCENCNARHFAAELQRALNKVLEARLAAKASDAQAAGQAKR